MLYYHNQAYLSNTAKTFLPEIEGVEWDVHIDESMVNRSYEIRVVAGFSVDSRDGVEANMPEILQKIHQIISNGQVKLELE